ncbi:DUF1127 domain-containing protein [Mesorhizobium sp.]|uniref:DUF1127 domain-containing protein n=1 Tax=Mesorhizobium sp. TaxID=1871066 RepID=UPI000FE5CF12|nr:DUF1127 domain-containing protein [Mesorhizobium sp.]RWK59225.1 MAG: DUF1127 domain-containing protein [Mesorhizobium sp.]RWM42998.1 MAG: DUF1127 domain-containing protein [Mesorhizobium sp.]RWM44593.1 MAG: DUF1127 domain-containing protein [Mesorhizobium sp.]RWM45658.1 MAG: DUF1127 domain-containing protein [Mesorhizobium sp.]RWM91936.1 MAG: DUF1127 domain-containing protein [Mesorhizobium sp.]
MAHTETRTGRSASKKRLFGSSRKSIALIIASFRGWRRTVARRRALADLTPDQLDDIGHPEAHRPALDIKAGLITKLMSMR